MPAAIFRGWEPIHYAASMFPDAFGELVAHYPVDLTVRTPLEGYSVLHCAARYGRKDVIKKLVQQHGMDINLRDKQGRTPLHMMLSQGYGWLDFFAGHGAHMAAITHDGWSALHFAVKRSPWHKLQALVEQYGVPAHQITDKGDTALHMAARDGESCNMAFLIHSLGLDPYAKNHAGKTPFDLAQEGGYGDLSFVVSGGNVHLADSGCCPLDYAEKPALVCEDVVREINIELALDRDYHPLNNVGELLPATFEEPYTSLVPILVKYLQRPLPHDIREDVVRALASHHAKGIACPALLALYHRIPTEEWRIRWLIGNTVTVVATKEDIPDLLAIVKEPSYGASREMFMVALRSLQATEAIPVMRSLLQDEDPIIRLEAQRTLESLSKVAT